MSIPIDFSKLCIAPDEVDMVIYHGGCVDGFTSAFCCYLYNKENNPSKEVAYYPAGFDESPPDVTGKNVLICDFSYKYHVLSDMLKKANKLAILDHHKTAEADLKDIPDKNKVFRMDHSGAYITWKFFNQHTDFVPTLIVYVQDNDIWLKAQPNTRDFTSFLFSVPMTFKDYEKLLDDEYIKTVVFPLGEGMMRQNEVFISQAVRKTVPSFVNIGDKYYFNAVLNTAILKSEIGNRVLSEFPYCDFSTMWNYDATSNETWLSLRSDDNRTDVSDIAKKFGGGGHMAASGVTVKGIVCNLPCTVLASYDAYKLLDTIHHDNNIVSLNTGSLKKELAKYLLQTKSTFPTSEKVTNACSILRIKNNNKDNYNITLSKVWHYDGFNNETIVTLHYSDQSDFDKYIETLDKDKFTEIKRNQKEKVYEYKMKGLFI